MGVLLIWKLVSVNAVASLLCGGGLLTKTLPADLPDIKHTQNLPYLRVES